jgi:hypothetical protein
MGEAILDKSSQALLICSVLYFYGEAASESLAIQIAADISDHWNEPKSKVRVLGHWLDVKFVIEGVYASNLVPETVWYNDNPQYNFFRIEAFASADISSVDGMSSNTGYFKLSNLLNHSTTAAHEYGHTLGLDHPEILDIRGQGQPGIMYPRGTLCDPEYQYDPAALPLQPGGTLDPAKRRVLPGNIEDLKLHRLSFNDKGHAVLGGFSSLYHLPHKSEY